MSDEAPQGDNPYAVRNHESSGQLGKDDVLAVASLLGNVTGHLKEIDERNVGGSNQYTKAVKMNPKQVLANMVSSNQQSQPQPPVQAVPPPVSNSSAIVNQTPVVPSPSPVTQTVSNGDDLEDLKSRIKQLEKCVESYNRIQKFPRGISYNISTSKIKGEFKNPSDIIDLVSTEISRGTKVITIRLNDTNKNKE